MTTLTEREALLQHIAKHIEWADGLDYVALSETLSRVTNMLAADAQDIARMGAIYKKAVQGRADFRDALRAQQVAVPKGWKLVPIEPTVEMLDAGYGVVEDTKGVIKATYRAMCAVAPIYMAKTKHGGEKCYFGNESTAAAWAGSAGVVSEVKK